MKRFKNGMKIRVSENGHPLQDKTGKVVRLLFRDDSAWVAMDEAIPQELASFPLGDSRRDHINLFPYQCSEV